MRGVDTGELEDGTDGMFRGLHIGMQTADEEGVLDGMSPVDQATLARLNAMLVTDVTPQVEDDGMFGDADEE